MSNKITGFPEDHNRICLPNSRECAILTHICISCYRGDFSPPLKILASRKNAICWYLNITVWGIPHKKNMFVNVHLIKSVMKLEWKRADYNSTPLTTVDKFAHCRQRGVS